MSALAKIPLLAVAPRLVVIAHNRLPWAVVRRLVRIVDFGDGTYALGWRWRKRMWLVK